MARNSNVIEMTGDVVEILPDFRYRVKLESGQKILGTLSGRMKMNKIRVLAGDKVLIELSPYDLSKGRITRRK